VLIQIENVVFTSFFVRRVDGESIIYDDSLREEKLSRVVSAVDGHCFLINITDNILCEGVSGGFFVFDYSACGEMRR
jgi:hypothetical protein